MADMEPGQIIIPHGPNDSNQAQDDSAGPSSSAEPSVPEQAPASTPVPAMTTVESAASLPESAEPTATEEAVSAPDDTWQLRQEDADSVTANRAVPGTLAWTAAEFIDHHKSMNWYGSLIVCSIVIATLVYLVTKDKVSTVIIVGSLLLLGAYAARKPQIREYSLDDGSLHVGAKTYVLQEFRTFSILNEDAVTSFVLMPLKRFMPPLTLYVTPEMAPPIMEFLAAYLPVERHKSDLVDALLRRIHF